MLIVRRLFLLAGFVFMLAVPLATVARAQDAGVPGRNIADMKFMQIPGMPTCATGSVQNGDPTKGASIIFARMQAGCVFPMHWHTPTETLMMVEGDGRVEMKDAKRVTLHAGGFAQMPSKHVHKFGCAKKCTLYVVSDAAFDMHYVDGKGNELSPAAALKIVGETPAGSPE